MISEGSRDIKDQHNDDENYHCHYNKFLVYVNIPGK